MVFRIFLQLIYRAFSDKARAKTPRGDKYRISFALRVIIFIFEAAICFFTVFMFRNDRTDLAIIGFCLAVPLTLVLLYFLSWQLTVSDDGIVVSRFLIFRRVIDWYDFCGYSISGDLDDGIEYINLIGEDKRLLTVSSMVEGYDTLKKTVARYGVPRRRKTK